jgi:hypothetical protein
VTPSRTSRRPEVAAAKLGRQPLAFGMQTFGPLPGTTDLFVFWGGVGDGLYLTKGEGGPHKRIEHPAARGTYQTVKDAQLAAQAFADAGTEED